MRVLDVGCVGQDRIYSKENWLHNRIKQIASEVVGVDIEKDGIEHLVGLGYHVKHIDELDNSDKYDAIVMGDVIEHIGDIEAFLNFYRKFLVENGRMIITTPNPFSFRQVLHVFFYSGPSINPEHTCHLDPITMLEVADRNKFKVVDFCWLREQKAIVGFKNHFIHFVSSGFIRIRKFYSQNFFMVISN